MILWNGSCYKDLYVFSLEARLVLGVFHVFPTIPLTCADNLASTSRYRSATAVSLLLLRSFFFNALIFFISSAIHDG